MLEFDRNLYVSAVLCRSVLRNEYDTLGDQARTDVIGANATRFRIAPDEDGGFFVGELFLAISIVRAKPGPLPMRMLLLDANLKETGAVDCGAAEVVRAPDLIRRSVPVEVPYSTAWQFLCVEVAGSVEAVVPFVGTRPEAVG